MKRFEFLLRYWCIHRKVRQVSFFFIELLDNSSNENTALTLTNTILVRKWSETESATVNACKSNCSWELGHTINNNIPDSIWAWYSIINSRNMVSSVLRVLICSKWIFHYNGPWPSMTTIQIDVALYLKCIFPSDVHWHELNAAKTILHEFCQFVNFTVSMTDSMVIWMFIRID